MNHPIMSGAKSVFGVFRPSDEPLHAKCLEAFVRGLERRKLPHRVYELSDGYQPCDVVVTFGVAKRKTVRGREVGEVLHQHELRCGPGQNLVIERGFIHRDRYFMVGWGGLNGRADFKNAHCPGDRFRKLGVPVAAWRTSGEHVVLCGQIPWDAAVQDSNHVQWCRETALQISHLTSRPIIFRPHPLQPDAVDMSTAPVTRSTKATLLEDLVNAWAVVTYNSNAGVESALEGIPAFVADSGAMGYSILNHDLKKIETPATADRQPWLANLAYTQWTLDEIADGLAILHLFEKHLPFLECVFLKAKQLGKTLAFSTPRSNRVPVPTNSPARIEKIVN